MKTWFAPLQAGIIALVFAAGGCAVSDVERLERTIVEKDYMTDGEIAALYKLASHWNDDGSPHNPVPGADAAYKRISKERDRRERFFGGEALRGVLNVYESFTKDVPVMSDEIRYANLFFAIGFAFDCMNLKDEMIKTYSIAASNGYWLAQKWLYTRYLEGIDVPQSYSNVAVWLEFAAMKGDGVAAEKLADLYENGKIAGRSVGKTATLYDMAAQAYVRQWRVPTACNSEEAHRLMREFNGVDHGKVAWYDMLDDELDGLACGWVGRVSRG